MPLSVPYYKSDRNFQRYALLIAHAITIYPQAFSHVVENEAMETFRRNFCYAVKSCHELGYEHAAVNKEKLSRIFSDNQPITCVMRVGYVIIGPHTGIREFELLKETKPAFAQHQVNQLTSPKNEIEFLGDIRILVDLISRNLFKPKPIFIVNAPEATVKVITNTWDVAIEPVEGQPEKWRIL